MNWLGVCPVLFPALRKAVTVYLVCLTSVPFKVILRVLESISCTITFSLHIQSTPVIADTLGGRFSVRR